MAGLRAFDTGPDDPGPLPAVVAVRRRPWLTRQVAAAARRLRYGPRPPRVRLACLPGPEALAGQPSSSPRMSSTVTLTVTLRSPIWSRKVVVTCRWMSRATWWTGAL
jgi:hypothetical protein